MNILIGDIGNTYIKLCLLNKDLKIVKKINFHKDLVFDSSLFENKIKIFFKKKNIYNKSLFSSVVPSVFSIFKKKLFKNYKINIIELKSLNLSKIIKLDVNKKQVGSDRIANAIGASYFYRSSSIVIDLGTATTFDIIINRVYKGGIIAPGIKLSLETLVKKAEQIPNFSLKKIKNVIGKNTVSALRSGFFWGYNGLIDNILKLIKKQNKYNFKIILTGGYSHLFKDSLKSKIIIDKDVTIKGLIKIIKDKKL